jgi:hypothetical protein
MTELLLKDDFNLKRFAGEMKTLLANTTGIAVEKILLKGFTLHYLSDEGILMRENIFVKGFNPEDHEAEDGGAEIEIDCNLGYKK